MQQALSNSTREMTLSAKYYSSSVSLIIKVSVAYLRTTGNNLNRLFRLKIEPSVSLIFKGKRHRLSVCRNERTACHNPELYAATANWKSVLLYDETGPFMRPLEWRGTVWCSGTGASNARSRP
jgi:hypothetical protein